MNDLVHGPTSELLTAFSHVADKLYTNANHVGRLTAEKTRDLLGDVNPTRAKCQVELFLNPAAGARVAAVINPRLVDGLGKPIGLLGFYECADDDAVAAEMLAAATAWLRGQGCGSVRGPVNFTTWHSYRFVTRDTGAGYLPGEPDHLSYYPAQWERAGFAVCSRYSTNWLPDTPGIRDRFAIKSQKSIDAGVVVRRVEARDLPSLYRLSIAAFAPAYMYSPIDPDEFVAIYAPSRASEGPTLAYLAEDSAGEALGFLYAFNAPLAGHEVVSICKTVAVVPGAQDQGVYHRMVHDWMDEQLQAGVEHYVAALMHCDGAPALMGWTKPATATKEYALFEHAGE